MKIVCLLSLWMMVLGCSGFNERSKGEASSDQGSSPSEETEVEEGVAEGEVADDPTEIAGAFLVAIGPTEEAEESWVKEDHVAMGVTMYDPKTDKRATNEFTMAKVTFTLLDGTEVSPEHVHPEDANSANWTYYTQLPTAQFRAIEKVLVEGTIDGVALPSVSVVPMEWNPERLVVPNALVVVGEHVIFTTKSKFKVQTDFVGIGGADELCQRVADTVPELKYVVWRALLWDDAGLNPNIKIDGVVRNVDGDSVFSTPFEFKNEILSDVLHEDKTLLKDVSVFTGADSDGKFDKDNCRNWKDNALGKTKPGLPYVGEGKFLRSGLFNNSCLYAQHLYCISQHHEKSSD